MNTEVKAMSVSQAVVKPLCFILHSYVCKGRASALQDNANSHPDQLVLSSPVTCSPPQYLDCDSDVSLIHLDLWL